MADKHAFLAFLSQRIPLEWLPWLIADEEPPDNPYKLTTRVEIASRVIHSAVVAGELQVNVKRYEEFNEGGCYMAPVELSTVDPDEVVRWLLSIPGPRVWGRLLLQAEAESGLDFTEADRRQLWLKLMHAHPTWTDKQLHAELKKRQPQLFDVTLDHLKHHVLRGIRRQR